MLCLTHCGKKKNSELARTYYKMSLLEINQDESQRNDGSYKKALGHIDKALDHDKKAEYLALKATILFKLGQEKEGYEYFEKALQLDVDPQVRAEILNNKACLLAHVGMKENNHEKIDTAIHIWDDLKNNKDYLTPEVSFFNQSKVYIFKNNPEKAKENLLASVSLSPSYVDAHYYLAYVAHQLNDVSLAKDHVKIVLFLEPEHQGAVQLQESLQKT
jgi:Tfp pilus assembly protein PilF